MMNYFRSRRNAAFLYSGACLTSRLVAIKKISLDIFTAWSQTRSRDLEINKTSKTDDAIDGSFSTNRLTKFIVIFVKLVDFQICSPNGLCLIFIKFNKY